MKIIRIHIGADDESHFEEIEVELNFNGRLGASTLQLPAALFFARRRRAI